MAFIVIRTFGVSDIRYLEVDDWARTPPMWRVDQKEATSYSSTGDAQRACRNHSGDGILET